MCAEPADKARARRAHVALFIALAAFLQVAETLFPSPVPWFRLGLGNALVLAALSLWGPKEGAWVALGKVLVGSLVAGRLFTPGFLLAFGGTAASTAAMAALLALPLPLGFVGISVAGAAAHALAQLYLAEHLLSTQAVWALAPLMGAASVATGVATGYIASFFARIILEEYEGAFKR